MRRLVLAVLVTVGALVAAHAGDGKAEFLGPADFLKLASDSAVDYAWNGLDELEGIGVGEFAAQMWPARPVEFEYPWVSRSDGGTRKLEAFALEGGCLAAVEKAGPLVAEGRHDEALAVYTNAAERFPRCYPVQNGAGVSLRLAGRLDEAIARHDRALTLNPYDYRVHLERGVSLLALGRPAEARHAYARALALRPHDATVLEAVRRDAVPLGVRLHERGFEPRALARREGDAVAVYFDGEQPYWFVYGLCKAVWLGEPEYRMERTGSRKVRWSLMEETQCLISMLHSYQTSRKSGKVEADPAIDRLRETFNDQLLRGFVLYDIAYRAAPETTLRLPGDALDDVVRFVEAHVMPERAGGS